MRKLVSYCKDTPRPGRASRCHRPKKGRLLPIPIPSPLSIRAPFSLCFFLVVSVFLLDKKNEKPLPASRLEVTRTEQRLFDTCASIALWLRKSPKPQTCSERIRLCCMSLKLRGTGSLRYRKLQGRIVSGSPALPVQCRLFRDSSKRRVTS